MSVGQKYRLEGCRLPQSAIVEGPADLYFSKISTRHLSAGLPFVRRLRLGAASVNIVRCKGLIMP